MKSHPSCVVPLKLNHPRKRGQRHKLMLFGCIPSSLTVSKIAPVIAVHEQSFASSVGATDGHRWKTTLSIQDHRCWTCTKAHVAGARWRRRGSCVQQRGSWIDSKFFLSCTKHKTQPKISLLSWRSAVATFLAKETWSFCYRRGWSKKAFFTLYQINISIQIRTSSTLWLEEWVIAAGPFHDFCSWRRRRCDSCCC